MKKDYLLKLETALTALLIAVLTACSSDQAKQSATKPAETTPAFANSYETGRAALQKMYIAARTWAPDARPYRLESLPTKDANGQNGKSGIWSAGFASVAKREVKTFIWSGIKADNAPEPGIGGRPADTYNAANTSTQAFDIQFLKVDSDAALEAAQKHGDKLTKKSPDSMVFYVLDWYGRENKLYWHVLYGESKNDPKLAVDIDASTGLFIKVEK